MSYQLWVNAYIINLQVQGGEDFVNAQASDAITSLSALPGLKVRKRRRSNGEIVVEVEGPADGQMMSLDETMAQAGIQLDTSGNIDLGQGQIQLEYDKSMAEGQLEVNQEGHGVMGQGQEMVLEQGQGQEVEGQDGSELVQGDLLVEASQLVDTPEVSEGEKVEVRPRGVISELELQLTQGTSTLQAIPPPQWMGNSH